MHSNDSKRRRKEAVKQAAYRVFNAELKSASEAEENFVRRVKVWNDGPVGLVNAHAVAFAELERLAEAERRKLDGFILVN